MMRIRFISIALVAVGLLLAPASALAGPDQAGSVNLEEEQGFPPVCNQPCYTAEKSFEVYLAGNPDTPAGTCAGSDITYVYQISHTGGAGPFVPGITAFEVGVETDDITSAGFLPGFGIHPDSTTVGANDVVTWSFTNPLLSNGSTSTKLFVCSPLLPGGVTDSMISTDGQLALDAEGTCVGPLFEPVGEPLPCTIGFWKNRYDGKKGTLKHFPDGDFDAVVAAAVALSGGIFPDAAALLSDLSSKGNRPMDQRARQQFAAFLLNLAAGDLFPDNTKCKLFDGNQISSNSCGTSISVGDALADFFADYGLGEFENAKNCADDTNNGIGVVGANSGE